jgi:hypothetical protein
VSGHCDFCGIWHSSSCFHPGRAKLDTLERDNARLQARVEELRRENQGLRADAERYRWLRPRYLAVDWEWGDSSDGATPALIFAIPENSKWSGDIDRSIDAARNTPTGEQGMKFDNVMCSQRGGEFGPGDHGFSRCADHETKTQVIDGLSSWADGIREDLQTATHEWERIAWSRQVMHLENAIRYLKGCQ